MAFENTHSLFKGRSFHPLTDSFSVIFIVYVSLQQMQILDQNAIFLGHHQCRINVNRGPWQLFSRGPLLTRDKKTYLNYMHASESTLDSGTSSTASHLSRHDMLAIISSRYQYGPFFVAEIMSYYLTTDGLKKISLGLLPEAP